jgi:hypothetical protein
VAQPTVPPHPFPAQGRTQLTITAKEISRHPEIGTFASPFESRGVCCEGVAAVGQARASCARSGEGQEESTRSLSTRPKKKKGLFFNRTEWPAIPEGAAGY